MLIAFSLIMFQDWERFTLSNAYTLDHIIYNSDDNEKFESTIKFLIKKLIRNGSFIAWFFMRTSHTNVSDVFTTEGEITDIRTVVVTG